jgi:hypothetical protein
MTRLKSCCFAVHGLLAWTAWPGWTVGKYIDSCPSEGVFGWHVAGGAACLRAASDEVEDAWTVFCYLDEGKPLPDIKARLVQPRRISELEDANSALEKAADGSALHAAKVEVTELRSEALTVKARIRVLEKAAAAAAGATSHRSSAVWGT